MSAQEGGGAGAPRPRRYPAEVVTAVASDLAGAAGVPPADARLLAHALVHADLHGASTHGVSRLPIYLRRIELGLIDPRAELHVERTRPAVLRLDAGSGLGHVQAMKALELLFPVARELGVATATIRNSQHFGALGYYTAWAAERDMILLAMTNCEPAMPPHGGSEAFFGTNPIAASFPTGLGFPLKVDLATSVVARGNIIAAARRGEEIPEGWAIDPEGRPTTDAQAALAGAVLTMAGHKGYALAFMVEALAGVLSGAAVGDQVGSMYKNLDRRQDVGHFFCLLDVAAFMEVSEWKVRIDQMARRVRGGRRQPGVEEILLPGERSHRHAQQSRIHGISLDEATVGELDERCLKAGVARLSERLQQGRAGA